MGQNLILLVEEIALISTFLGEGAIAEKILEYGWKTENCYVKYPRIRVSKNPYSRIFCAMNSGLVYVIFKRREGLKLSEINLLLVLAHFLMRFL